MSKAFTIVEVLVAVALIVVVMMGLLQTSENNTKIMTYSINKERANELSSLVLLNANEEWDRSEKSFYDFIEDKFDIDNDDLRRELKDIKVNYKQEESKLISLSDFDEDLLKELNLENFSEIQDMLPQISIQQIIISSENIHSNVFVFKSEMLK